MSISNIDINGSIENVESKVKDKSKKKTAAFYTLGCKVNQYETEIIKKDFLDN